MPNYHTIWKVMDKADKVLFEGTYGKCEQYIKENKLTDINLEPFMIDRDKK